MIPAKKQNETLLSSTGKPRTPYGRSAPRSACDKLKGAAPPRVQDHAVPAWGAEVVSSNIVGYQKINLVTGYNMVGAQFKNVGEGTLTRPISTIGMLDSRMSGYDNEWTYTTEMLVWDPSTLGYTTYGWAGTSGTDVDDDASYDNQWLDQGTEITTDTISITSGFWIHTSETGTMTISGEVTTNSTVTVNLVAGYNLVANPFPAEVPVKSFGTLDPSMPGYDSEWTYDTELLVWNPATLGYTTYGWAGTSGTDVDDDSSYDNQWLDQGTEITTDKIPAGSAVWIHAGTAGSITFTFPSAE